MYFIYDIINLVIKMNKVIITADSGVNPIKKDENIIPALINSSSGITYNDGEISNKEILERSKKGEIFKTSSPTLGSFEDVFKRNLNDNKEIIHLCMSSGISSGSYQGALTMKNILDENDEKISIFDTLQGGQGGTILYEVATNLAKKGIERKEIIKILTDIRDRMITSFLVPNPEGFIRSGRDKSHLKKLDQLKLTYVKFKVRAGFKFKVNMENGNLYNSGNFKCKDNIFEPIVKELINEDSINNYDSKYVVIGNVFEKQVDMNKIIQYIKSFNYFENVIRKDPSATVAAYGCDDLCGISLVKKINNNNQDY